MENSIILAKEDEREMNGRRFFTNLNLENESHVDMILDTQDETDFYLKDCVGKKIDVVAYTITERDIEDFDDETGEQRKYKKRVTILFDKDHKSYVSGSNALYMSFELIKSLKGEPSEEKPLPLEVINREGKEKGHNYLKVRLAK